jgi:hypothetical protein
MNELVSDESKALKEEFYEMGKFLWVRWASRWRWEKSIDE